MRKSGFTIVELLVSVAIIAILSVIAFGQYRQSMIKANDVRRKGDLSSLYKALLLVYGDMGRFLTNSEIPWGGELVGSDGTMYMKLVPEEPNPDFPYFVQTADDDKKMAIFATLENPEDIEYNKYCPGGGGYLAGNGITYHYVILSPNASVGDSLTSCTP